MTTGTVTCQQLLNTIGLVLGMVGVIIIFRFGPPQPSFETGVPLVLQNPNHVLEDGRTLAEHNKDIERLRQRHAQWSKAGLILVFFGFALQLWATWV
jgi:hypothetical protein